MAPYRVKILAVVCAAFLTACGGGGGGGEVVSPPPVEVSLVSKGYSVSVTQIDASVTDNGDPIDVDVTDISASGTVRVRAE